MYVNMYVRTYICMYVRVYIRETSNRLYHYDIECPLEAEWIHEATSSPQGHKCYTLSTHDIIQSHHKKP